MTRHWSQVRSGAQSLRSSTLHIWSLIVAWFVSIYTLARLTLRRKHYVELCTNEEQSALASGKIDVESDMSIMELIKTKCPSLYGPSAFYSPTWWILGYVNFTFITLLPQMHRLPIARN